MIAALVSVVLSVPLVTSAVVPNEPNEAPAGANEVTRLLDDPCWRIRLWGADVLGQITPPPAQAIDALRMRADDPVEQPLVRSFALKALAKMGTRANVIVPDLPCLIADPNWLVRQSAEETAENVGRGSREDVLKTLPDVQRLLKDNANVTTSFDHFAQGPTPELLGIVPQLIGLLGDPRYDVRRLSAAALGGVGWSMRETANSGQEFLDGIAKAATPLDSKEKATVSDRVTTSRTLLEQTESALAVELCDGEPAVRVAAVDALRRMLREKAAPRLIEKLSVEGHPGVQRALAEALGSIGAEAKAAKVVAPIEAALVDLVVRGDGLTRESAVVALGQIVPGTDSGTAKLREVLLVDPDTRVKTAAYEALQIRLPHTAGM